ncbi:hypothetical protein B7R22_15305 [Subtercola boreus]|uniref:DUF86 domain-containing protein n=1 Tax=Subtercola boreus TaxID=120213 RepID=A0A3E0VRI4_9MICO|nr:HepT-like ribonuclease domain-containing protein [Subtercola boreus]RFA12486.1 hypothetical protein B7R22_15305 [Subtercola boreus]
MTVGEGDSGRNRFRARSPRESSSAQPRLDTTPEVIEAMLELAADADAVVALGWEHFDSEAGRLSRHAADAIVIKFHELCDRLTVEVRDRHPNVPWGQIRGMRNRLGHHYQANDYQVVWNTIKTDVPAVVAQLTTEID